MEIRIWPRSTHRPKRKMNNTSKCITIAVVDCLLNVPYQFKLRVDATGQIEYGDWIAIWEKEMMARPFPPSFKFTCRVVPYHNNRGRQPHNYILVWLLMGWSKMIMTDGKNNKLNSAMLCTYMHSLAMVYLVKMGSLFILFWELHVLRPIRCKIAAPQSYN